MVSDKGIKAVIEAMSMNIKEEKYSYEKELLLNHEKMMDMFFEKVISEVEGSCCRVDKAHFVRSACVKALNDKQDYSLQETYRDYHNRGGDLGGISLEKDGDKICYWCPKIFKNTEEAIKLYRLYTEFNLELFLKYIKELKEGIENEG